MRLVKIWFNSGNIWFNSGLTLRKITQSLEIVAHGRLYRKFAFSEFGGGIIYQHLWIWEQFHDNWAAKTALSPALCDGAHKSQVELLAAAHHVWFDKLSHSPCHAERDINVLLEHWMNWHRKRRSTFRWQSLPVTSALSWNPQPALIARRVFANICSE